MTGSSKASTTESGRLGNPESFTEYFEVDSLHVGDRFGISVSLPRLYGTTPDAGYPALYATDGNVYGPIAEAVMFDFDVFDAVVPIEPFMQVSIGFTAKQTPQANTLRMRNFVAPGASIPEYMQAHVSARLGPAAVAAFCENFAAGRADRFLAFIEEELHPEICRRYRVQADAAGLFGYSGGGLFSLYAMTSGSRIFSRYGAGAAGVFPDAPLFKMYEQLLQQRGNTAVPAHLHLVTNAKELFGSARLYRLNVINLLRFYDTLIERPLHGLQVTTEVLTGESHSSGWLGAYRSFVRACYRKDRVS
ncbi:hypothetical protein J7E49_22350 [Variovorax paradoxus]|nr:hypothetical protein [Variovorax paradoxus]